MKKKLIGFVLGIVVCVLISIIPPMEPLTTKSMMAVGILAACLIWMTLGTMHDYVATLAMCTLWVVLKVAPMGTVFSTFSTGTWWLMVGALGLGVAASESGLLRRISTYMLVIFPATYKGQSLALIFAGLVSGPLIPSSTAKVGIIGPIGRQVCELLGFERNSKGAAGIFLAIYNGVSIAAPMFLSSSFIGYACIALMPEATRIGWLSWFFYSLPWSVFTVAGMTLVGLWYYKPDHETTFSSEEIQERVKSLGPWNRNEKITMVVLGICLVLWMTELLHGVPAAMTACAGVVALLAFNVYGRIEFRAKMAWDTIFFIGLIIGLGSTFTSVKIDEFIRIVLTPYIGPVMQNTWLFIPAFCIVFWLVRLLISSFVASITLTAIVLLPFAETAGIHPYIIVFLPYAAYSTWNVIYQTSTYIIQRAAMDGDDMVKHGKMVPTSFLFMGVCLLGFMFSIPFWKMFGLC